MEVTSLRLSRLLPILPVVGIPLLAVAIVLYPAEPLRPRDLHAQPASYVPQQMVAVAEEGKTFHDPKCSYIHGKPVMTTAEDAVKKGYVPCVRCMRKLLKRK